MKNEELVNKLRDQIQNEINQMYKDNPEDLPDRLIALRRCITFPELVTFMRSEGYDISSAFGTIYDAIVTDYQSRDIVDWDIPIRHWDT